MKRAVLCRVIGVKYELTVNIQSKAERSIYYPGGFINYPLTISYPSFPLNSRKYADVNESNIADDSAFQYYNLLYLNEADGLVKAHLNRPSDSEKHFVWEQLKKILF